MAKSPTPIPAPPVKIQPGAPSRAPAKKRRRKKKRNPFLWFLQGLVRRIYFGLKTGFKFLLLVPVLVFMVAFSYNVDRSGLFQGALAPRRIVDLMLQGYDVTNFEQMDERQLMQVAYNYKERGMRVLILKPAIDTKGQDSIISRLGISCKVDQLVTPEMDVVELVKANEAAHGKIACVLCDESQFFTPQQADELFMVTVELNIPVICYGLRSDFSLKGFPGSTRLLELAHTIEEMKTICTCGRKATCNCRKVNGEFVFEGEQVAIDLQNDVQYVSMCPQCYFKARKAFYAKRAKQ